MDTSRSTACTKKPKSTLNAASATMAAKGKRAKVTSTRSSSDQASDDLREVITRLESGLEVERRSNTQLRREKAREVQQVKEAEQSRSSASQKDLAARLHLEKQRDLEALRENLRSRHEAEIVKAIRHKDAEIKRLQRDLQRCQDELKEEIAKRGLSTSARNAFELERAKMLQEIKELTNAKKQLEDALRAAADAEKLRNLEVRQTKENCKLEVAKVEKEAAMEVRKLLEELKSKDHLLAQLDRNQYPDRSNCLRQHLANQSVEELLKISSEIEAVETKATGSKQEPVATATPSPTASVTSLQNISWQKKVYELEKQIRLASGLNHAFIEKNKEVATINNSLESKIKNLADENKELNSELTSAKTEMKKMTDRFSGTSLEALTNQLERLRKQIKEQEQVIAQLRLDCQEKDRMLKKITKPKKAVRFLLPGETVPLAPGFDIEDVIADSHHGDDRYGDDNTDSMSVDSDVTYQSSQPSDTNLTDDDREFMEPVVLLESVEKDYELLMKEHLALEQSYASLIHSYSVRNDGEPPPEEWKIERESLNLAIWALEQKVRKCEENEELLRIKLEQVTDEKEELEFKVLEQEQCFDGFSGDKEEVEKPDIEMLESELVLLRQKLERYEHGARASERDVGLQCDVTSQAEPPSVDIGVIEPRPSCMELSVENLSRLGLSSGEEEVENDSGSEMVLSFSTTASSGFDEITSEADESSIVVNAHPVPKTVVEGGCSVGTEEGEKKTSMVHDDTEPQMKTKVASTIDSAVETEKAVEAESGTDRLLKMEATIKSFQALESSWKTTLEKLERQLQQSLMRERIIRDQMVLVEEEKNRRISALQGQIEVLEDNETRLADTIQALEDMALGVDALHRAAESPMEPVPADELEKETKKLEASRKQLKEQVEQLVEAGRMLSQVKVKYTDLVTVDEPTQRTAVGTGAEVVSLVDAVEAALCNAIRHLESVNGQMEEEARKERELRQRIQHLEEASNVEEDSMKRRKECPPSASAEVRKAVMDCAQVMSTFAVEELEADLKELRTLLIKLKAVIDSDEVESKVKVDDSSKSSGNKEARERLGLEVQPMDPKSYEWMTVTPPGVKTFGKYVDRDQDATDYELRQKVEELEKECERLKNLVHEEDQVIRDLHFQNLELCESEKNLHQLVERLEMAEEQMHEKMEEMADEMERLQGLVKLLEVKERMARSQLVKHQESEAELEEQLEQTVEEMKSGKRKADRRIAELENEKKVLILRTEDQVDRIGDLEGLAGSLKLRIRNLEASDASLRNEIRKLEAELSSAGGALTELEQHREALAQQVQDLEREKSKLLFEIADLTMDSNKQGQKITVLNQQIGKLRGSLVNKDEVISFLQAKLDIAGTVLEALRAKVADYESSSLVAEDRMEASVREQDNRIRELEEELQQNRETVTCHQSTQTDVVPIRARIVIEKATSAFRDSFLSLRDRHPLILREFLSASLLPLLSSYEASPVATATVSKETMKRFIASLQVDFTHDSRVKVALESDESQGGKRRSEVKREEERQWNTVEDPRIIHEVRTAEDSNHWKDIESQMGLDTDDLALTIEFKDTVETNDLGKPVSNDNQSLMREHDLVPPPLPTSSPPPLSPEPFAIKDDADESADEASEINDEDDGAIAQPCSDSIGPNWSLPYLQRQNEHLSPRQPWPKLVPQASLDSQLDCCKFRSRSVDRDCGPINRNTFHGSELSRIAAGSVESITDSGMDSMKQGTSMFPRDASKCQGPTRNSAKNNIQLRDQGTQVGCDGENEELRASSSIIVLRTQMEQREKELTAKSNEMDRLTVELRRWQQEAVAAGEEKVRLSALLGCALKDIKVMRESSATTPTTPVSTLTPTRVLKSPFGFIGWGASVIASERPPRAATLASQIPVSIRQSSSTSDKDVAPSIKGHSSLTPSHRPASLHCSAELSHSSSSSMTDCAPTSDSCSSQTSPSEDRRAATTSHLPRPIKDFASNCLISPSCKKEADRLFRQSFESSRTSSSSRQYESSPCAIGPESIGDSQGPLATAAEPTTSTTQGAAVF